MDAGKIFMIVSLAVIGLLMLMTMLVRMYRKAGFEVYGTEPRALKVGSRYVDEHHMILRIR